MQYLVLLQSHDSDCASIKYRIGFVGGELAGNENLAAKFISSELGADKPDPEIYRRAVRLMDLQPNEVLHVGDDRQRDWEAATAAGLSVFCLDRPRNSLRDLLTWVGRDSNPEPTP